MLSAFFWGYPLTQIHGGQIAQKYGAKYVLVFSIGICAISTTFTPLSAIYGGAIAMCANQMVQGMAQVSENDSITFGIINSDST